MVKNKNFMLTAPISYTGGTVTSGTTFNGTIGGIEYCLTFEEEVDGLGLLSTGVSCWSWSNSITC